MSIPTHPTRRRSSLPLAALVATACAALALALAGGHAAEGHSDGHADAAKRSAPSAKQMALHDDMRRLWEDHITWTRLFIVSASADLPDLQATTERLLRNQQHIGDAIKPFYGRAAGERLSSLLTDTSSWPPICGGGQGRRPGRRRAPQQRLVPPTATRSPIS